MTSYYMRTPSDIYVECGWGGKEVDDAIRRGDGERGQLLGPQGPCLGHRCAAFGRDGFRHATRPVQVMEGNYFQHMAGICPWWDEARGKARWVRGADRHRSTVSRHQAISGKSPGKPVINRRSGNRRDKARLGLTRLLFQDAIFRRGRVDQAAISRILSIYVGQAWAV